ncbi:MAG TPA: ORF6N domain-containing protein [Puia sp.]|nr:ORF6N domain-containing protein [Puia sp.]
MIREKKVMLDFDLSEMYNVETKQLKYQTLANTKE